VVFSRAAIELDLIKTFTMWSYDTGPEFVHRANRYRVCACRADFLAIFREIAT
jgi:hypothetical protein